MINKDQRQEVKDSLQKYAESLGFSHPRDLAVIYPEQILQHLVNETFNGDKKLAASTIVELAFASEEHEAQLELAQAEN